MREREVAIAKRDELLDTAPPLDGQAAIYVRAWHRLASCRPVIVVAGASAAIYGPIPWTAIDAWCARAGFDDDAFNLVVAVLEIAEADRNEHERRTAAISTARPRGRSAR